jgi:hypothetical protein
MQYFVVKFVSEFRQVSDFLRVFQLGPNKVRNEIETKRNETKSMKTKRNETNFTTKYCIKYTLQRSSDKGQRTDNDLQKTYSEIAKWSNTNPRNKRDLIQVLWVFQLGPNKVRNEIETKRNETKSMKTKRNETTRNQQKRNETKRKQRNENEIKRNQ